MPSDSVCCRRHHPFNRGATSACLVAFGLALLSSPAFAAPPPGATTISKSTHEGWFAGGQPRTSEWVADVPLSPKQVDTAIRRWKRVGPIMGKNADFVVRKNTARTATLFFEKEGPAFLPTPTLLIEAKSTFDATQERGSMTWTLLEGLPDKLQMVWRFEPHGEGMTRVTFRSSVKVPTLFVPFLESDRAAQMQKSVKRFQRLVGASTITAPSPSQKPRAAGADVNTNTNTN